MQTPDNNNDLILPLFLGRTPIISYMRGRLLTSKPWRLVPLFALLASWLIAGQNFDSPVNRDPTDVRMSRVLDGLLPAAIIRGQPLPTMRLTERMRYHDVPGVSIAFFDNGDVRWARSFGLADVAANRPVTQETLFQAASISKSVTALAALRLVQDGKLKLDEDVNFKLKSWKVPENEFTKTEKVTLREILSHTAGLTVFGYGGYSTGKPLPTTVQVLNGEKPANSDAVRVDAIPGRQFRYSGGGYVVAQLLMTDVTGKTFPQLMRELVLQPLGMTSSTFDQPLPRTIGQTAARPYDGKGQPVQGGWHTYPEMAPAGLWTTPSDLARLAIEIQRAYAGQSKLLSESLAQQMLSYQSDGVYGLGVALGERGHALSFSHSGGSAGYTSFFEGHPESGQGVVIMTNGDNGLALIGEIQRGVSQEYGWSDSRPEEHTLAKIDPATLRAYTGMYLFGGLFRFTITQKNGALYAYYPPFGNEPQELLPESDVRFFMTSHPVVFDFQKESDGSIRRAQVRNGSEKLEGEKISDPTLP